MELPRFGISDTKLYDEGYSGEFVTINDDSGEELTSAFEDTSDSGLKLLDFSELPK